MAQLDEADSDDGDVRRFDVELFIKHPTLTPAEITAALGIEPDIACCVGEQRRTRRGDILEGTYPDTRWRYSVRHHVKDQWFAAKVEDFVEDLITHKIFLTEITSTGGAASVIIQFLGDGYFGDSVPRDTLAKLVELGVNFDIEVFMDPQRP